QSSVSFSLKALERAAGARLLNRTSKGVSLTASGKILRRYASRIVSLRDEALAELRADGLGEVGAVRVAASTIPGEFLLPAVLAAPSPVIQMTGSTAALKRCVAEGLGLAFVSLSAVREEIAAGKLAPVVLPGLPIRRTFHVARLRGAKPPPAVRALIEIILR